MTNVLSTMEGVTRCAPTPYPVTSVAVASCTLLIVTIPPVFPMLCALVACAPVWKGLPTVAATNQEVAVAVMEASTVLV